MSFKLRAFVQFPALNIEFVGTEWNRKTLYLFLIFLFFLETIFMIKKLIRKYYNRRAWYLLCKFSIFWKLCVVWVENLAGITGSRGVLPWLLLAWSDNRAISGGVEREGEGRIGSQSAGETGWVLQSLRTINLIILSVIYRLVRFILIFAMK